MSTGLENHFVFRVCLLCFHILSTDVTSENLDIVY